MYVVYPEIDLLLVFVKPIHAFYPLQCPMADFELARHIYGRSAQITQQNIARKLPVGKSPSCLLFEIEHGILEQSRVV